jgi:hypothetical protein
MNYEPDYSSYSWDDLLEARNNIDRKKYPERAQRLEAEIEDRAHKNGFQATEAIGAWEMAEKRRRRRKTKIGIIMVFVIAYVAIAIHPLEWDTVKTDRYPGGVEIRTTKRHEFITFAVGPDFIFPFPWYHVIKKYRQEVNVQGKELFQGRDLEIYPSPTGKYVFAQYFLYTESYQLYHTQSDKIIVGDPEAVKKALVNDSSTIAFHFIQWEDDEHFLVEVARSPDHQSWRVNAATGEYELSPKQIRPALPRY